MAVSATLIAGGLLLTPWLATAGAGLYTGRALLTAACLGPVTTAAAVAGSAPDARAGSR